MKSSDKLKKGIGAGVLSLGLVVGLAGFAGAASGTIGETGPRSNNEVKSETRTDMDIENDNDLRLTNNSVQQAYSGESETRYNTTGGDATSGDADNSNTVSAEVEFDNSSSAAGVTVPGNGSGSATASIENTGPKSNNVVKHYESTDVDINNDNNIHISNNNEQSAHSGDAKVSGNTTGGSATSGSVSNTSSSTFTVRVTN